MFSATRSLTRRIRNSSSGKTHVQGPYITNGAVLTLFKRSAPERPLPDLFCMAFWEICRAIFPGYSREFATHLNYLTWAVLKAHTNNCAGEVTLRSADPRGHPEINFRYFQDGTPGRRSGPGLGCGRHSFVRKMTATPEEQRSDRRRGDCPAKRCSRMKSCATTCATTAGDIMRHAAAPSARASRMAC